MRIVTPLPYQAKGVRKIWHFNGRALLADEMGLGKTVQSLLFGYEAGEAAWPIVVVCPASLKWNWQLETLRHINMRSHLLMGRSPPNDFRLRHPVLIINYDILGDWLDVLLDMRPQLVIVDECHKLANPRTQQTKNTRWLCKNVPYVLGLSGTPLLSRPAEMFSMLHIIRPDVFDSRTAFEERYCHRELKPWGWQAKGAENLSELNRKLLRTCMIRRLKVDVLHDLPAKTRNVITLPIERRNEYNQAVADFIGWLTRKSAVKARKARKAEKVVRMGYLKRLAAELKLQSVLAWIDDFLDNTDEKLIVFGVHRFMLGRIFEHNRERAVLIDGSVLGQHRQHAVNRFNKVKRCRLCIGQMKAAGVGWSCTSASTVAFCELGWTPGEHTQAEDRIHGLERGLADVRAMIYYLVARKTIESQLCNLIQTKQQILEETLDGIGRGDHFDIFDQLESLLIKQKEKSRDPN